MPKLKIVTFGCQANELDSARIAGLLAREGYSLTEDERDADLIILNGCSIRDKAEQKLYSRLGTFQTVKDRRPELKLGVAGCLGQREGEALLRRFPYLDLVVGNGEHLAEIPRLVGTAGARVSPNRGEPTGLFPADVPIHRDSPVRAWVGIMEGCDNFCAFCVVPFTRGRERSRPAEEILREVADLCRRGYREIVLLGQTVNSYGLKLNPPVSFAELLRRIDREVAGAVWVRFTTSHPKDVTADLAEAMATLPSLCAHVHLPVQSGSSRTLARMRRAYTREEYLDKVRLLTRAVPDIALTTDLIVGFPGETDDDFSETLSLMRAVRFDACFAFKFSPRSGTPAAEDREQIPESVKAERLAKVLSLQNELSLQRNRRYVGRAVDVLVDRALSKRESGLAAGRTRRNTVVHFGGGEAAEGSVVAVRITEATSHHLKGVLSASS
jgi:tRNA-2-methylthio-N6-dimethylallyladenosine synthase